jgi:hypothetical protein
MHDVQARSEAVGRALRLSILHQGANICETYIIR